MNITPEEYEAFKAAADGQPRRRTGDVDGAAFFRDAPAHIEAIWGQDEDVLWAEGEPTMLYGPDGVGKTTIAQQLMLALIGVKPPQLLGLPVRASGEKVLYLSLDRPKQAARSGRRMTTESDRELLAARLAVWRGTPPFDIVMDPGSLARFASERGARHILIDSLKDLAPKLSDEETGSAVHRAWTECLEQGMDVLTFTIRARHRPTTESRAHSPTCTAHGGSRRAAGRSSCCGATRALRWCSSST